MDTLTDRKRGGVLIVLLTLATLRYHFEVSPVVVVAVIVAVVVLGAVMTGILRPQTVRNPWRSRTGPMPGNDLSATGIRTQAFFRTGDDSFVDDRPEPVDEDIPAGGPLFNSICYRLGQSWHLHDISISVRGHWLSAHVGIDATILFELALVEFDDGWMFVVEPTKEATAERVREFVRDAHDIIRNIPDVHDIRWFKSEHQFPCGVFHEGEFEHGTPSPCDLDNAPEAAT